jgi:hypothetical protein
MREAAEWVPATVAQRDHAGLPNAKKLKAQVNLDLAEARKAAARGAQARRPHPNRVDLGLDEKDRASMAARRGDAKAVLL